MASAPNETPKHPGHIRHCWNCGENMGWIENRYYDRTDVCGKIECNRAQRDAFAEERQDYYDGGW